MASLVETFDCSSFHLLKMNEPRSFEQHYLSTVFSWRKRQLLARTRFLDRICVASSVTVGSSKMKNTCFIRGGKVLTVAVGVVRQHFASLLDGGNNLGNLFARDIAVSDFLTELLP